MHLYQCKGIPCKKGVVYLVFEQLHPRQMGLERMGTRTNGHQNKWAPEQMGTRTNGSQINEYQDKWKLQETASGK